ncbi:hypothetical protein DFA_03678 [Cavenderia fasciculata]|uniref:Uncharacterized protein n=1 Tax=Cavenderia fasciculata TaxID=261658 RepID=F4Q1P1_CACFS|nr:uncharacterized protein DFA_03678 [Cavenderia fasciculata]EGG18191.1 hypothetical protein DFA_03678 [Cavenderia fasciculata]|eukprot:XP_004357014.1 hypothetical protein DFA_03678 [Cavenderia fasciculata]
MSTYNCCVNNNNNNKSLTKLTSNTAMLSHNGRCSLLSRNHETLKANNFKNKQPSICIDDQDILYESAIGINNHARWKDGPIQRKKEDGVPSLIFRLIIYSLDIIIIVFTLYTAATTTTWIDLILVKATQR